MAFSPDQSMQSEKEKLFEPMQPANPAQLQRSSPHKQFVISLNHPVSGYRTRSILAIPIMSEDNSHVVGVIQMINKVRSQSQAAVSIDTEM